MKKVIVPFIALGMSFAAMAHAGHVQPQPGQPSDEQPSVLVNNFSGQAVLIFIENDSKSGLGGPNFITPIVVIGSQKILIPFSDFTVSACWTPASTRKVLSPSDSDCLTKAPFVSPCDILSPERVTISGFPNIHGVFGSNGPTLLCES